MQAFAVLAVLALAVSTSAQLYSSSMFGYPMNTYGSTYSSTYGNKMMMQPMTTYGTYKYQPAHMNMIYSQPMYNNMNTYSKVLLTKPSTMYSSPMYTSPMYSSPMYTSSMLTRPMYTTGFSGMNSLIYNKK